MCYTVNDNPEKIYWILPLLPVGFLLKHKKKKKNPYFCIIEDADFSFE